MFRNVMTVFQKYYMHTFAKFGKNTALSDKNNNIFKTQTCTGKHVHVLYSICTQYLVLACGA